MNLILNIIWFICILFTAVASQSNKARIVNVRVQNTTWMSENQPQLFDNNKETCIPYVTTTLFNDESNSSIRFYITISESAKIFNIYIYYSRHAGATSDKWSITSQTTGKMCPLKMVGGAKMFKYPIKCRLYGKVFVLKIHDYDFNPCEIEVWLDDEGGNAAQMNMVGSTASYIVITAMLLILYH